jgi:hypothetical protein
MTLLLYLDPLLYYFTRNCVGNGIYTVIILVSFWLMTYALLCLFLTFKTVLFCYSALLKVWESCCQAEIRRGILVSVNGVKSKTNGMAFFRETCNF